MQLENREQNWIDKYDDKLADFLGMLTILIPGIWTFLFFLDFFPNATYSILFFVLAIIIACVLALFTVYLAERDDEDELKIEKEAIFVIDEWSITTLEAIEAPIDLIKGLESIRGNEKEIKLNKNGLQTKLTKKLGKVRMKELIDTALKYTQRSDEKPDNKTKPSDNPSKNKQKNT